MELFWDSRPFLRKGVTRRRSEVCSLVLLLAFALLPFLPRCKHAPSATEPPAAMLSLFWWTVSLQTRSWRSPSSYVASCQALAVMSGTQQTAASPHHCHPLRQWHRPSPQGTNPSLCFSRCCLISSESHS